MPLQFQESRLENVTFVNCVFTNVDMSASAFTSVEMTNVSFAGGRFRNTNGQATVFNKLGTFGAGAVPSNCMQWSGARVTFADQQNDVWAGSNVRTQGRR